MPTRLKITLALLILAFALTGCFSLSEDITPPPGYQPPPTQPPTTPTAALPVFPVLPPDPARGAATFSEKCAPCHGNTGLGDGEKAVNISGGVPPIGTLEIARASTPAEWYMIVAQGNMTDMSRIMPAFDSLTVPQRWDVIAYVYSLSTSAEDLAQGQAVYADNCAGCHGDTGLGDGPRSSELSSSPLDFSDQAFMGERSAQDFYAKINEGEGEMPAYSDELSENDRWALADYLRFLTFIQPEGETEPQQGQATPTPAGDSPADAEPVTTDESAQTTPEGTGMVQVAVVNGAGGDVPVDAEVILYGYDNMQEAFNQSAALPENGILTFENVPMKEGWVYLATVEYDQVVYGSNLAQVTEETTESVLEITVYDVSNDPSLLVIDRMHVFFEFLTDDTVQVIQLLLLSNPSGQTVAPVDPESPLMVFALPEGATNLSIQESMRLRYSPVEGGLGIGSVRPSSEPYEVTFAYDMPYVKEKLDLELPIPLDTMAALVIAPQDGVKVRGDQLADTGARDLQGVAYSTYSAENLSAGDTLTMSISGLPKTNSDLIDTGSGDSNTSLVIGLAAFGVTFVIVGLYLWKRNRQDDDDWYDDDTTPDETALESAEELMDAILSLDDLHKSGELGEDAYRRRRSELKTLLQKLTQTDK